MRELLGGKGANLAEMTVLGMPVPQGFTVSTEACTRYYEDGKKIAPEIERKSMRTLQDGRDQRQEVRRFKESSSRICSFRCKSIYAGYDGYYPQPRS